MTSLILYGRRLSRERVELRVQNLIFTCETGVIWWETTSENTFVGPSVTEIIFTTQPPTKVPSQKLGPNAKVKHVAPWMATMRDVLETY